MLWDDFYDRYSSWSESTLKTRISSLEDIGNGEEVVDVCLDLCNESINAQLIRKAMKLGVTFTHDDLMNLEGEIPDALFEETVRYAGFSVDQPYFDETDFDWDDFYAAYADLSEDTVLRCIPRIKRFGASDEVVEVILSVASPADDVLYDRATACGIRFTKEQIAAMGRENLFFDEDLKKFGSDEQMDEWIQNIRMAEQQADEYIAQKNAPKKRKSSLGKAIGLGAVLGIFKGLFGGKRKHGGRCDGDCAHCPAHYGYRYGRWYYGHGHNHGCEFGGNKGGGGRD